MSSGAALIIKTLQEAIDLLITEAENADNEVERVDTWDEVSTLRSIQYGWERVLEYEQSLEAEEI